MEGSPAHAGIDPISLLPIPGLLRFPRTRGDRPQRREIFGAGVLVPRTRGDRPDPESAMDPQYAVPRTAGIDP